MKTPSRQTLMRIYLEENDRFQGRPVYQAIVEAARQDGLGGAIVLKGVLGYGYKAEARAGKMIKHDDNPPVLIEIVDAEEKLKKFQPRLDEFIREALVTFQPVEALHYKLD
ncbi:MAG: DUF190 domain-containing protein [Elusimicrobiota bacterium]|jgi:hypothetical protein